MPSRTGALDFSQACTYLGLTPDEFTALGAQGLVPRVKGGNTHTYDQNVLALTQRLLALGDTHAWEPATLAWFADLVFASQIGRTILLPIVGNSQTDNPFRNWLETPYVTNVLNDIDNALGESDGELVILLRCLIAASFGGGQFWENIGELKKSSVYPIIAHLEQLGVPILDQHVTVARDAELILFTMIHAFTTIASPISHELAQFVQRGRAKLKGLLSSQPSVSPDEQDLISREALVAVDKLYVVKAPEIHSPTEKPSIKLGVANGQKQDVSVEKRTISFEMEVSLASAEMSADAIIDNIIDLIRPFVGPFGARVIRSLYEIANDAPYWRNPVITVETNDLLDRLSLKRTDQGYHRAGNRERLRDVLNIAHKLEIVGEYSAWENGQAVRKAFQRAVLSIIGATFDAAESKDLSTSQLFQHGLPKTVQIKLNFYDGIRRPDGRLGNQYVLLPHLASPQKLPSAYYSRTEEQLRAYLLLRYRQNNMESRTLTITRSMALERAGITNKNTTRATQSLRRALDKLVSDGTIKEYSPIPLESRASFTITLGSLDS